MDGETSSVASMAPGASSALGAAVLAEGPLTGDGSEGAVACKQRAALGERSN